MRTYVITGGTAGIGFGLGAALLARGDRVLAVGSSDARGGLFLDAATRAGARDRAEFLRADLATLAGTHRAISAVTTRADTIDALVLGAQHFRPTRTETADGFESTFALAYLSRYLLGHELRPALEPAAAPVVFNIAGPGGLPGRIHWDDPQLRVGYTGGKAAMQSSRCNDLLAVHYPVRHPGTRIRYVLHNPMFTRTAMADPLPTAQRVLTRVAAALFAQPVSAAIVPILDLLDAPPSAPVSAYRRRTEIPLGRREFDPDAAARLDALTRALVDRHRPEQSGFSGQVVE